MSGTDDRRPLTKPFDGKPWDAMKAGYCPFCLGTGRVVRFVPYEDEYPCSGCDGSGRSIDGSTP